MKTYTLRLFGIRILQFDVVEWEMVMDDGPLPEYEPEWPPHEEEHVVFEGG